MINIIICMTTNLFRIYLISRFIHLFVEDDKKKSGQVKHLLAYGVFYIVNTAAYLAFHTVWVNIACNLIGIGLIVFTYTKSVKTILFVTCSVYMINMGCSTISILPFVNYKDGVEFNQI